MKIMIEILPFLHSESPNDVFEYKVTCRMILQVEKQYWNKHESCNLIKQGVLFYKTSIFSDDVGVCWRHGEVSWSESFFPVPFWIWWKTGFAYLNLMKFLMTPGNSKTICRSESSVSPSPIDRWLAHTHSFFLFQAQPAVQLSCSA